MVCAMDSPTVRFVRGACNNSVAAVLKVAACAGTPYANASIALDLFSDSCTSALNLTSLKLCSPAIADKCDSTIVLYFTGAAGGSTSSNTEVDALSSSSEKN